MPSASIDSNVTRQFLVPHYSSSLACKLPPVCLHFTNMNIDSPESPFRFCFRLISTSRVPLLHERYLTSSLLHTHPPPFHLRFLSCFPVIEPTVQGISPGMRRASPVALYVLLPCHHYTPLK
ncbi:hypothetical protein TNCT_519321 [Trichonephila clavata]|uniref:Uncharacterized protein n=1 Tax=Trichonephila clavata TaxID=2740835 RepID=A0A8X6KRV8_TRICU|nr:hypothetical protein TNCT_519321 [Trichonephila clavata]